jgi:peroxiredoxin
LADYRDHYDEIRQAGGELVVIAVDAPVSSEAMRRTLQLPFLVLSDTERQVVREWGVYNPRERGGIATPAVFVIEPGRRVRFAEVDGVTTRVHASAMIPVLRGEASAPEVSRSLYVPTLIDFLRAIRNQVG